MPPTDPVRITKFAETEATDGLSAVHDSQAYRLAEVERHFHGYERWYGVAGTPTASHLADRIDAAIVPFTADGGNGIWGNWVQVFGSADTPAGWVYFDAHRLQITAVERTAAVHFFQMGIGATSADILTAGTYTELVFHPQGNQGQRVPVDTMMRRAAAGSLIWVRVLAYGSDTGTVNFYLGLHGYEG